MYSLNVKSHLEGLIASYLSAFVEDYDSSSLSIGIWQGHITLKNLKLKPHAFDVRDDFPIKLEYGLIENIQIIIPWTQIQSGNLSVVVDKVHLVVRCFTGGGVSTMDMSSQDSLAFQRKMNKLDAKERNMLGDDHNASPPSLASGIIESFLSSLKSNVMNGISITVSDIKISILSPLSRDGEVIHTRIGVESMSIKKSTSSEDFRKKNAEFSLQKHIEVHGISVEVNRKTEPRSGKETFLKQLGCEEALQLVLNPTHLTIFVSLWRPLSVVSVGRKGETTVGADDEPQTLSADCSISNFELTPHVSHMYLIQEGLDQAKIELVKRFGGLRPSHPPAAKLHNARAWWRYAISAVLRHLYGEAYVYKPTSDVQNVSTQRSLRNRYIVLYSQLIESRILQMRERTSENNVLERSAADRELNDLHKTISFDKLVLYRAIVHQNLQNLGCSIAELRKSVSNLHRVSPSFWKDLLRRSTKDRDSLKESAVDDDIDSAILSIFADLQTKEAEKLKVNQIILDVSMTVPRFAISFLEEQHVSTVDTDGFSSGTSMPSITMVMYGFHASYEQGELSGEQVFNVRLGAMRLYGVHGVEIMTCGEGTDSWLYKFDILDVPTRELALSLQLQWCVLSTSPSDEDMRCFGEHGDGKSLGSHTESPLRLQTNEEKTHVVMEVSVSPVKIHFDGGTISFLCSILTELGSLHCSYDEFSDSLDGVMEESPFQELRRLCALHSINNPKLRTRSLSTVSVFNDEFLVKWSINLSLGAVSLYIPYSSTRMADSCKSELKYVPPSCGNLVLSCGKMHVQSGDFLERNVKHGVQGSDDDIHLQDDNLSNIPTRSIWPDVEKVMAAKLRRVNGDLLVPVTISLSFIEVFLVSSDLKKICITRVPWGVRGLVTPCALQCHKMHPDLQLEIYCSPLNLQCNSQDLLFVIEAFRNILSVISGENKGVVISNTDVQTVDFSHVRVKRLANLCTLRASLSIDEVALTLLSNNQLTFEEQMRPMLRSYIGQVHKRGTYSRAVHTAERLMIQRMRKLGIDVATASTTLHGIRSVIDINRKYDTNELISENIRNLQRNMMSSSRSNCDEVRHCEPWASATLSGIHVNRYSLTYDKKTSLFVEEVVIVDQDCNPVFHAFCETQAHFDCLSMHSKIKVGARDKSKNRRRKKSSATRTSVEIMAKQLESTSIASYSALSVVYIEQDASCSWGGGGYATSVLYERHNFKHISRRQNKCTISLKNLDVIVSPNGVPKIVSNTLPLVGDLYERCSEIINQFVDEKSREREATGVGIQKRRGKRSRWKEHMTLHRAISKRSVWTESAQSKAFDLQAVMAASELTMTYGVTVECVHIVCAAYESLLAESAIHKLRIDFVEHSRPKMESQNSILKNMFLAIENIELHDLSESGSKHPTIIWRERKSTKDIMTVKVNLKDNVTELEMDVQGLRFLFLTRFLTDFSSFLNDHICSLINSSFSALNSTIDKVADKQRCDLLDADELESLASVSSSDASADESSGDEDIAGNAFFEYPIPNLDPDAIIEDLSVSPSPAPVQSNSAEFSQPTLLRTLHLASLPLSEREGNRSFVSTADEDSHVGDNGDMKISWRLVLANFNIIFPRNSGSEDLVAMRVGQLVLCENRIAHTWDAPGTSVSVIDQSQAYYFCIASNKWKWTGDDDHELFLNECSVSSFGDHADQTLSSTPHPLSRNAGRDISFEHLPADVTLIDDDEYSSSDGSGDEGFQDTFDEEQSFEQFGKSNPPVRVHSDSLPPQRTGSAAGTSKNKTEPSMSRYAITMHDVDVFCSVVGPFSIQQPPVKPFYDEHKHFVEIRAGRPVYSVVHNNKTSPTWSTQHWNKITPTHFNMTLVIDGLKDSMRVLLCETSVASALHLKVSMGELYLLQSVYFDNLQETGAFFEDEDLVEKLVANRNSIIEEHNVPDQKATSSSNTKPFTVPFPEYGTLEFWIHMRRSIPTFEFLLVRSKICLECSMDTNYFPHEIPALQFLSTLQFPFSYFDLSENRRLLFASVHLRWMSFHLMSTDQIMQVALGSSGLKVQDLRGTNINFAPTIIEISPENPNIVTHGYSDFDYGLKEGQYNLSNAMDVPFKLTYFGGANWKTVNIGLDAPDFNMKNLDVIWLLTDFFACYYNYNEFGNPGVIAFNLCAPTTLPYGGFDSRVFVKRPHIQTRQSNSNPDAQMLFVEADTGLFVRYMYDTLNSARVEVLAQDVSIVLMDSYHTPAMCRGVRGTTGSGHGTRTILEFFTVSYSNQYDHTLNQVDNLLAIVPSSRDVAAKTTTSLDDESDNEDVNVHIPNSSHEDSCGIPSHDSRPYINFDDDSLVLPSCAVNSPKCVSALGEPARDFPVHCCSIMSSYEDLLFAGNLITEFLGMDDGVSGVVEEKEGGKASVESKDDEVNDEIDVFDDDDDGEDINDDIFEPDISRTVSRGVDGTRGSCLRIKKKKVPIPVLPPPAATFAIIRVQAVRTTIVDHILGLHLPLAQIYLSKLALTMDEVPVRMHSGSPPKLSRRTSSRMAESDMAQLLGRGVSIKRALLDEGRDMYSRTSIVEEQAYNAKKKENPVLSLPEVKMYGETLVWADYYNNLLKCWEPFVEPLSVIAIHEKSRERGMGFVLRATSVVHANLTLAMIRTVNDCLRVGEDQVGDKKENGNEKGKVSDSNPKRNYERMSSNLEKEATTIDEIKHVFASELKSDVRVGFSMLNVTGNPLRYLQSWGDDGHSDKRQTVEYLQHNEKGLLNFIASNTVLRNNQIVEESFSDQSKTSKKAASSINRKNKRGIGHRVTLQIAGYKWTSSVQADTLGIKFIDLESVVGTLNAINLYERLWKIKNALKLVCEVRPHNGGRILQLSSTFVIKNCTNHAITLCCNEVGDVDPGVLSDSPFRLPAGESFYVPFALLTQSVLKTNAKSLGYIWLSPEEIKPIQEELGLSQQMIGRVSYTIYPINLMMTVDKVADILSDPVTRESFDGVVSDHQMSQLSCSLSGPSRKSLSSKTQTTFTAKDVYGGGLDDDLSAPSKLTDRLPSFCYNLEIETIGHDDVMQTEDNANMKKRGLFHNKERRINLKQPPLIYSLAIHPPIVLENLLPMTATFELVHAVHKRVLWSSVIAPGKVKSIHTVNLDNPILLLINLDFCRSSEGVLVHKPPRKVAEERGLAGTIQKTIEGFLEDSDYSPTDTSIVLTDAVGQRLRLEIENKMGGGGHRSIVVYCPYWIVNTSQYAIRLREDGAMYLPAGTVTPQRDGTTPVTTGHSHPAHLRDEKSQKRVFPGKPGPLHASKAREIAIDSPLRGLLRELSFEQVVEMSSMFSFLDSATSKLLGSRKVIAQVDNSNWSSSFTLESAGVIQTLSVNHAEMGVLELSFKINTAPGRLANYTKIVRFSPRFVVINKLLLPARIVQVNGFRSEQQVPIDIAHGHLRPFHLPTLFGERQLAIQLNGPWLRSVSFDIDKLGSYTMTINRKTDTSKFDHILTRGAPEYNVEFESGEIGIWFETDWDLKIVVMRLKPGSYAATRTDVTVGDVLLCVNGVPVDGQSFDDVMRELKVLQADKGCELTFQTVEQKLRLIRESAKSQPLESSKSGEGTHSIKRPRGSLSSRRSTTERRPTINSDNIIVAQPYENKGSIPINIEMRMVDSSVFMILSELDSTTRPEYRVVNNSHCNVIHFRQKGIHDGWWASLDPGMSAPYIWDNPIKSHRLLIRIGANTLCPADGTTNVDEKRKSFFSGNASEKNIAIINFDDIGSEEYISVPGVDGKLKAQVFSEGPTKVLKVFPGAFTQDDKELHFSIDFINAQLVVLEELLDKVNSVYLNGSNQDQVVIRDLLNGAQDDIVKKQHHLLQVQDQWVGGTTDDEKSCLTTRVPFHSLFGPLISRQDQLMVEVISTAGTKQISMGGKNETYCEVSLRLQNASLVKHYKQKQRTYVNDESLNPKWQNQIFIFDVPVKPQQSIRGYCVRVKVKNKSYIGQDDFLGQADIQFASLESENVLRGWFPLQPQKSSIKSSPQSLEVSGSIKLRVQWIHSPKALAQHIRKATNSRIDYLSDSLQIQQRVLKTVVNATANVPPITRAPSMKVVARKKKTRGADGSMLIGSSQTSFRMSAVPPANIVYHADATLVPTSRQKEMLFYNNRFSSVQTMCSYYKDLYDTTSTSRLKLIEEASTMRRGAKFLEQCGNFMDDIEGENLRSFTHAMTKTGRLEITPIQALHLPDPTKPVYVKFTYGDLAQSTVSAPPTAYPVWDSESLNETYTERDSRTKQNLQKAELLTKSFEIDTLNSFGDIGVHIMQERFPYDVELARLEIPIFEMLYCICTYDGKYDRWFPLSISKLCVPTDGDMGTSGRASCSEKEDSTPYSYNACIRLALRWISPEASMGSQVTSQFYSRISLPALSLSVIDSNKSREVMQLVINDIEARHTDSLEKTDTSLNVAWIQIDNQLPQPLSPVILAPTSVQRPQPALRMHIRKNNNLSHEHLESFDSIEVIVQEFDMHLEQQTVLAVWDLIKGINNEKKSTEAINKGATSTKVSVFKNYGFDLDNESESTVKIDTSAKHFANGIVESDEATHGAISAINKVYIDRFAIAPMKINVSFIMTPYGTENDKVESSASDEGMGDADKAPVSSFLYQVGEVVLDLTSTISDSPIKLNGLTNTHMFETWDTIFVTLQSHYLSAALSQMYKIVGSLDLVGNPVGLLSSLGVGVKDFFFEPASALINNPTEIKRAGHVFMKGGVSLLSNTADGVIATATTMTRSVGKGLAALTMDEIFLRNREKLNKNPELFVDIVARPFKDIGNGVYCGVVGVFRVPYNGALKNGPVGFVTGVAGGIAGIAAKPVVGILDAVTHTGEGCRHALKSFNRKVGAPAKRRRYANVFGPDGRLMPFSYSTAYGAHLLRLLDQIFWDKNGILTIADLEMKNEISGMSFPWRKKGGDKSRRNKSVKVGRQSIQQAQAAQMRDGRGTLQGEKIRASHGTRGSATLGRSMGRKSLLEGSGAQSFRTKVIINSNADMKQMESVIYTAVIARGPGDDQLVIVTTKRVVVGEYKREKGWAWVDVIWQCALASIQPPVMERSGGGTVSLLLKGHVSRTFSRLGLIETSESITADYDILVNLSNCLHTILHEFDLLIHHVDSDTWIEDSHGVVRVGSWQYHRPEPDIIDLNVDSCLQEKLELCKWVKPPHATRDATSVPKWLSDARNRAMDAHGEVKALKDLAAAHDSNNTNPTIAMCKDKLEEGHMTGAEFKLFMERELQYGKSMKPEPSTDDNVAHEEEKKFLGLNLPINVVRFAHKIKGVVGPKKSKMTQGLNSLDFDDGVLPATIDVVSKDSSHIQNGRHEMVVPTSSELRSQSSSRNPEGQLRLKKNTFLDPMSACSSNDESKVDVVNDEDSDAAKSFGTDNDEGLGRYKDHFSNSSDDEVEVRNVSHNRNIRSPHSHSSLHSEASVNDVDDVDYYDGPFDTIASNDASTPSASEVMDRLRNMELLLATVLPSTDTCSDSDGDC